MSEHNDRQVGGNHYANGDKIQHWDWAWENEYDLFQYIITKWLHRWKNKGGVEDLKKAQHALEKYISIVEEDRAKCGQPPEFNEGMNGYVNQGCDTSKY